MKYLRTVVDALTAADTSTVGVSNYDTYAISIRRLLLTHYSQLSPKLLRESIKYIPAYTPFILFEQ